MDKITLATWNKGPSLYRNSIEDINKLLQSNPIDILAIQELNVRRPKPTSNIWIYTDQ